MSISGSADSGVKGPLPLLGHMRSAVSRSTWIRLGFRDNFVIWGPHIVFRETGGIYQPFIIVAGLDVSVSKTLRQKGLHETVLKFLELRVIKRRTFFELEKALDELKRKLDELACPGEMRAKGTARRRHSAPKARISSILDKPEDLLFGSTS